MVDPGRFPALSRVVADGVFSPDEDLRADFDFGLSTLLEGVAVHIARCGA